MATKIRPQVVDQGTIGFSIESRVIRELGERLVKQPEVALIELIKNAYDADATTCDVILDLPKSILVRDDGHGMTLDGFKSGWMRIGTSLKATDSFSRKFRRVITGEKGIGRFAVRFLGRSLDLESVAYDKDIGCRTLLTAHFDWPQFDNTTDLSQVQVPYRLIRVDDNRSLGTALCISNLREIGKPLNLDSVRTASTQVITPYRTLLSPVADSTSRPHRAQRDPGFTLRVQPPGKEDMSTDVAAAILEGATLRATVELKGDRLKLNVYRQGERASVLRVSDQYANSVGWVHADIRFFPKRKGTLANLPVDGRIARTWIKKHSGVAVFDRTFQVFPYGTPGDDWLVLAADTAKRAREPISSISRKHFPMDEATRASTQLNYMLRLPYPEQLIGVVQVEGQRSADETSNEGLSAAADREGFIENAAFRQLQDLVRGAVEAIANVDREIQLQDEKAEQVRLIQELRKESRAAIREIEANPNIKKVDKDRIVRQLAETQTLAEKHEAQSRQREASLEVMSLLGVVAGFMTHEFGVAVDELTRAQRSLAKIGRRHDEVEAVAAALEKHLANLRGFVTYSQGYIHGASTKPTSPYPARPRVKQVIKTFGHYSVARRIEVNVEIDSTIMAPLVPVSLYNGIALNLFTNALKALTAKTGGGLRQIVFRAWNEPDWHYLEVSDTGIGIPESLRERIFEPLFTTTESNRDPLGSGMGLGLALVRRGVQSFGGRVSVVDPPPGFATCVRVKLPLGG